VARPRPKARAASGSGALLVPLPPNLTNRHAAPAQYVRIDHTVYQPANCASVILAATGSRVKVKLRSNSTRRKTGASRCGKNSAYLRQLWRVDERTRTAYPCSLRVCGQALQGVAEACKSRIPKGVSFPCLAACCTVLRSRWYQDGRQLQADGSPMARTRDRRSHNPPTSVSGRCRTLHNRLI
jgi:hypothetical protein